MSLFTDISATSNALKMRAPMIVSMMSGTDPGGATFTVESGLKDLRTMLAEGKDRGMDMPLVERTLACFDEARRAGWGDRDGSALAVYWSNRKP